MNKTKVVLTILVSSEASIAEMSGSLSVPKALRTLYYGPTSKSLLDTDREVFFTFFKKIYLKGVRI